MLNLNKSFKISKCKFRKHKEKSSNASLVIYIWSSEVRERYAMVCIAIIL